MGFNAVQHMMNNLYYDSVELGIFSALDMIVPVDSREIVFSKTETFLQSSEEIEDHGLYDTEESKPFKYIPGYKRKIGLSSQSLEKKGALSKEIMLSAKSPISTPAKKKPDFVATLEKILEETYQSSLPIRITKIREIESGVKEQVKEISFWRAGGIYKVWMFKADPVETYIELTKCYIADKAGIRTGKPIGFVPSEKENRYQFDAALLGGVVEHAGETYHKLIHEYETAPELLLESAMFVARFIADCHVRLADTEEQFARYNVNIPVVTASDRIKKTLYAALAIDDKELLSAVENLVAKQMQYKVMSHNDPHTKNIITPPKVSEIGLVGMDAEEYAYIDWKDLGWNHPFSDLVDFFTHFLRDAEQCCVPYDYDFSKIKDAYIASFNKKGSFINLEMNESDLRNDALIESAVCNLCEMYDPSRKNSDDIRQKAIRHMQKLNEDLDELSTKGFRQEIRMIRKSLNDVFGDIEYIKPYLS